MATSIRQFHVELYQEHLDEASFLYEQRLAFLHDPEVNWPDLQDLEGRFEAHIDALLLGADLAIEVCRQRAAEGDTGELHAALRVFCRCNRKDDAFAVLSAVDPADDAAVLAASQALRHDAPRGWRDDLLQLLQDQTQLTCELAQVIGYRRFACEGLLARVLAAGRPCGHAELAWALGRVGTAASIPTLRSLFDTGDERTREAAAIALLRLGDDEPIQRALNDAASSVWARRVLAIAGDSRAVRVLMAALEGQRVDAEIVLALGLLGDLTAVAPLLDLLGDRELSVAAAVALNTITGAGLHARVFVSDEFDADELSDEERAAFEKDGTLPTRHGQPYGNWERHPLLDRDKWHAWLNENKHRFRRDLRWRMGRPHGPAALLDCLRSETNPYALRAATYDEFVARFGLDVPFEADLPVPLQRSFLARIEQWVAQHSNEFEEGFWHFRGEPRS